MIEVAALSALRMDAGMLQEKMRSLLDQPMRREGTLAKLFVTGMVSCISGLSDGHRQSQSQSDSRRLAIIWASASGPRTEINKVINELCDRDSMPMPFDFIASQCSVAAVYAARYVQGIEHSPYMPADGRAWQQMLCLASAWLEQSRFDQVLCGWVDEGMEGDVGQALASDWILLAQSAKTTQPLAYVSASHAITLQSQRIADADFIPSLEAWLADGSIDSSEQWTTCSVTFHR
jgi:hypothetical protein